jgi:hypothetical protein
MVFSDLILIIIGEGIWVTKLLKVTFSQSVCNLLCFPQYPVPELPQSTSWPQHELPSSSLTHTHTHTLSVYKSLITQFARVLQQYGHRAIISIHPIRSMNVLQVSAARSEVRCTFHRSSLQNVHTRMLSKVGAAERRLCSGHEPGSNPSSIMLTSLLSCLMQRSYLSCTAENRWSIGCKMSWWTSSTATIIRWVPSSVYWTDYETYGTGIESRQR